MGGAGEKEIASLIALQRSLPRLECGRADARGAQRGREVALARFALLPSDGGQDCPGQAHGLRRRARGECDRRYRTRRIRSLWRDHRRQLASRLDHSCVLRTRFPPTACTCQAHLRPYASCHFLRLPPATCTSAHELNHSHSYALAFTEKHRGFAFVQFDDKGDAADAIDNMNGGELFGRVLRVNLAKPDAAMRGSHRPVWEANADGYFKGGGENGEDIVETEDLE